MKTLYESILDDIDPSNNKDEVLFATIANARDNEEFRDTVDMLEQKLVSMKCKQMRGAPQGGKLIQIGQDFKKRPSIWLLDYDVIPRRGLKICMRLKAECEEEVYLNPSGCRLYKLTPKAKSLFDSGWKIISEQL